jgi:ribonuclease-3
VLDFIVGEWAYHRFPEKPEGDLTKIRANIVKNEKLADFSRRLELASALRLGRGEQSSGGHERDNLLGSAFEALIGAIYLDAGLDEVRRFVNPLLEWKRPTILDEIEDPKSELQELTQSQKRGTPHYVVVNTSGPDHAKVFEVEVQIKDEVVAQGTGTSKSAAQHDAARKALKKLRL